MTADDQRRSAADAAATAAGAAAMRVLVDTVARRSPDGRGRQGGSGASLWRSAHDSALPVAEEICAALGRYLARKGPDVLRERLLPKFLEAFESERSR